MSEGSLALALSQSFDVLSARARLANGILDREELADWGELCLAAGYRDEARLLLQIAAITAGFSPHQRASHDRVGARTGLWAATTPYPAVATRSSIDIALTELRTLGGVRYERGTDTRTPVADGIEAIAHRIDGAAASSGEPSGGQMITLVDQLFTALGSWREVDIDTLSDTLQRLTRLVAALPTIDVRAFAGASVPLLAAAIASDAIRRFLSVHRDLFDRPHGHPELFWRAARLDSCGLGPYLCNVQQIARRSQDVFELAHIAAGVTGDTTESSSTDAWLVRLSRDLHGPLLDEMIDDLGDRNMVTALDGFLERIGRPQEHRDLGIVMRIRDAALDNLEYPLAGRAQSLVVDARPGNILERVILAAIDTGAERYDAAESALMECLAIEPHNEDVARRLAALRDRRFARYMITKGFGSPEDRQLKRLERRQAPRDRHVADRASLIAVEVNY